MTIPNENTIVVFDVEGVIIPKARFLLFEMTTRLGLMAFLEAVMLGLLYEMRILSLKSALTKIYRLLKGISLELAISVFQSGPLMPGVRKTILELRDEGFKIFLISSGIPRIILEKLGESLDAEIVVGPEIGVSNGFLTGNVWGDVIEPEGKFVVLEKILRAKKLSSSYCVGVADDRNNLSMFKRCDLTIGYRPDFVLNRKANKVVKGEFSSIVSVIKGKRIAQNRRTLSSASIKREFIHIGGFCVSLFCVFLMDYRVVTTLILGVTLLYIISETRRMLGKETPLITRITLGASESFEYPEFMVAPILYALGMVFPLWFFPESIAHVSIAVLTLGDGFAAVFGQRFGRTNLCFNKDKSLEGTVAGMVFSFFGSLLFINPLPAFIAAFFGMFVEHIPLPISDNLTVPFVSGLVLLFVSMILPLSG